jgi:plasmid stabilization system
MHVKFHNRFFDELNAIKEFIAKDSVSRANSFVDEVFNKCLDLKDTPTAHRLSQKVKKSNARDLIFKGYVIPYLVDDEAIYVLGIYKANEWEVF